MQVKHHRYHKPPTKRQKKRISKFLSSNEDVLIVSSIGSRYFWLTTVIYLIIPLILVYLGAFMFMGLFDIPGYSWVKYLTIFPLLFLFLNLKKSSNVLRKKQSYVYVLTSHRILIITGIFTRKIVTAPLNRITHITIDQSFTQRYINNTGHLVIITAGFDQKEIIIENIANPVKFKILVEELTQKLDKNEVDREESEPKLRAISI